MEIDGTDVDDNETLVYFANEKNIFTILNDFEYWTSAETSTPILTQNETQISAGISASGSARISAQNSTATSARSSFETSAGTSAGTSTGRSAGTSSGTSAETSAVNFTANISTPIAETSHEMLDLIGYNLPNGSEQILYNALDDIAKNADIIVHNEPKIYVQDAEAKNNFIVSSDVLSGQSSFISSSKFLFNSFTISWEKTPCDVMKLLLTKQNLGKFANFLITY